MTTPNPRGMIRDTFWDKLALAQPAVEPHWSYNPAARLSPRKEARRARLEKLLADV